ALRLVARKVLDHHQPFGLPLIDVPTYSSSSHRVGVIESRSGANEPCSWIVALIVWCSEAAQFPGSSTITETD
ncbi:MAG: hypothetical protein VW349_13125, partial [Gammaproteobacteria bacterium]